MMSKKRFVCIDIGYGDDWYITDNGKRLSEIEIVNMLNEQQSIIHRDEISIKTMMSNMKKLEEEKVKLMEDCACQYKQIQKLESENEYLRKELKGLNRKYIAFSEATDKRLKEMMR